MVGTLDCDPFMYGGMVPGAIGEISISYVILNNLVKKRFTHFKNHGTEACRYRNLRPQELIQARGIIPAISKAPISSWWIRE